MKSIDKHIEELLYHYDCVIIPDLGGFITSDANSYIDKKSNILYPPSKRILFNKNLLNNDGLLANKIAKDESLTYQQANEQLIQFKDTCFLSLDKNGRVEIEKVGVLFFDKEKNLQFQQGKNNFLTKSFGLPTKFLMPIAQESIDIKQDVVLPTVVTRKETEIKINRESVRETAPKTEKTTKKRIRTMVLPMLLIPALLGGIFVANQYGYVGESKLELSSLNPFLSKKTITYSPRTKTLIPLFGNEVETLNNKEVIISKDEAINEVINEVKTELPYQVVGGCFAEMENANSLIKEWETKGYTPKMVGKSNGLYRVSLKGFTSREEAIKFQDEIKNSEGLSSWILKK